MERKKCNIKDLKMISGLLKLFVFGYVGLEELNVYKEEDGYKTTLVVEDAKDERRLLTYNSYANDSKKVDGEYYFPVDGKQKKYQIMKISSSVLLLLRGDEFDINQMYYLQNVYPSDYGLFGSYVLGFDMIGETFKCIPANEIVDMNFLTESERKNGLSLKKIANN